MLTNTLQRPSVVDAVADHAAFGVQTRAYGRAGSIRVVLPGLDDPEQRVPGRDAPALTNVIIDTLDEVGSINEIEVLSFTGHEQQEVVLTPKLSAEQPAVRNRPIPTTIQDLADVPVEGRLATAQNKLADHLDTYLPDEYGLEKVAVDFDSLGITDVPACRLCLQDRREPIERNIRGYAPHVQTVQELARANQPHILQTLVRANPGNDPPYLVSHRLAVFDPSQLATSHADYVRIAEEGRKYDLANVWSKRVCTTNYQFPIGDFTKQYGNRVLLDEAKYKDMSLSERVWQLYDGSVEYRNLLAARSGFDPAYEKIIGYPRMPVTDAGLRNFLGVVPVYYDTDPWEATNGRDAPRINTDGILRSAPGVDHSMGPGAYAVSETDTGAVANVGSDEHDQVLSFAITVLNEEGYDAEKVTQNTDSVPDGTADMESNTAHVEAEVEDIGSPGTFLVNTGRAVYADRPVIHATKTRSDANSVYEAINQPFNDILADGTLLYNQSTPVSFGDNHFPVITNEADQARWVMTPDGTLTLRVNGDVIAEGDPETPVATWDYDCPRYRLEDGTHTLVTPEGYTLRTGERKQDVLDDWMRVTRPYVPLSIHYLDAATVRFKSNTSLDTYDPTPTWFRDSDGKRDIWSSAVTRFLKTHTISSEGAEIEYDELQAHFSDWFIARIGLDDRARIDDLVPPTNEFGRALPDYVETKQRDVDGDQTKFIRDRTLAVPDGLVSPDLPFVDPAETGETAPDGDTE